MTDDLYVGEARLLRRRLDALEDRLLRRLEDRGPGTNRMVGRVYSQGAIPTTSAKFYACHPVTVTGDETEGSTPILTVDTTRSFLVDLLRGTAVAGDDLVCRRVDHRWVATKGAAPTPPATCATICTQVNGCFSTPLDGATVDVTYREIASFTITNGGSGYTTPPSVVLNSIPNSFLGNGGTATAVISGGVVTGINVVTPGKYAGTPGATFSGGGGSGAAATIVMGPSVSLGTGTTTGQAVYNGMFSTGTNYTSVPTVGFSGGGSPTTTATATANLGSGFIVSPLTLDSGGSGYTSPPTITFSPAGATATTRLTATTLASATVVSRGSGYASNPTVTITGGNGTGATAKASIGPMGTVNSVLPGSGYTTATVGFSGGGGSGAAATAVIVGGQVVSYTITDVGSGYTSDPAVTITGDGTGATATATALPDKVAKVQVTGGGSGYTQLPTIAFGGGGGGSGASATAVLTATGVGSIVLGGVGNYAYPTTVTAAFSGGGGSGAAATPVVKYHVSSLTMTNAGAGYTSAPTATITGGGGSGASATIAMRHQFCVAVPTVGGYLSTGFKANYNPGTAITTFSICNNAIATPVVTMGAATGYSCNGCCPNDVQPVPDLPATLFVNDGFGIVTLTKSGSIWYGCATRVATTGYPSLCGPATANVSVSVLFAVSCNNPANGQWALSVGTAACADSLGNLFTPVLPTPGTCDATAGTITTDPHPPNAPAVTGVNSFIAAGTCTPFSMTFPVNFTTGLNGMYQIYGTSTVNMPVTS